MTLAMQGSPLAAWWRGMRCMAVALLLGMMASGTALADAPPSRDAQPPAAVASSPLVFKPEHSSDLPGPGQWVTAAVLCLLGLAAAVTLLRRRSPAGAMPWLRARGPEQLALLERCALSPQHQMVRVRDAQGEWLLLLHPQGAQVLRSPAPADRSDA